MNLPNKENEYESTTLDLESLSTEYKNLLIEYKQAVFDYVNYLKEEDELPCGKYEMSDVNIDNKCFDEVWRQSGCTTTSTYSDWTKSQTLSNLILDSFNWATMTDYNHRMGCYGNPGNQYIIIGVGTDGKLYSRDGLDAPWKLVNDDSNGNIKSICTGNDGSTIIATNVVNNLDHKPSWDAPNWQGGVENPCCVKSVAQGPDGTIVGVGMDSKLYSKPDLNGQWKFTSYPWNENVIDVCIPPDNSILVVGGDLNIYKKDNYKNLEGVDWTRIDNTCCVYAITIAPDGKLIGVGTDYALYVKADYKNLTAPWSGPYNSQNNSCCVVSITTVVNKNYDSSLYNTQSQPNYNINQQPLQTIKGQTFWGESSLTQNNSPTLQECQASCAKTNGCTGATYNSDDHKEPICALRSGDGNIISGLPNDYAIVPKGKLLLMVVDGINEKLIKVNEKILSKIQNVQPIYNNLNQQRELKSVELIRQYKVLTEERDKIKKTINEYQSLDQAQIQGDISTNQNYYSFLLLLFLVIAIIFILIKITISSNETTSTTAQIGGAPMFDTFYFLTFVVILIVIYFYNKKN